MNIVFFIIAGAGIFAGAITMIYSTMPHKPTSLLYDKEHRVDVMMTGFGLFGLSLACFLILLAGNSCAEDAISLSHLSLLSLIAVAIVFVLRTILIVIESFIKKL